MSDLIDVCVCIVAVQELLLTEENLPLLTRGRLVKNSFEVFLGMKTVGFNSFVIVLVCGLRSL